MHFNAMVLFCVQTNWLDISRIIKPAQDAKRLAKIYPVQVSVVKYEEVAKKPKTTLPIILKVFKRFVVTSKCAKVTYFQTFLIQNSSRF